MTHSLALLGAAGLLLAGLLPAQAATPVVVQNETVRVSYDAARGRFTLARRADGHPFVINGTLAGLIGPAEAVNIRDAHFGAGRAIVVTSADGRVGRLMVFPRLPFALLRLTLSNPSAAPETLTRGWPSPSRRAATASSPGG